MRSTNRGHGGFSLGSLLFVVLRLREEGARTLGEVWAAFRDRRLLDVEFVLIIAGLGSVPEILLGDYSSTHYFAADQQWLALGLTLAVVLRPIRCGGRQPGTALAVEPQSAHTGARGWLDRIRLSHVLVGLLGLFAVGTFVLNTDALLGGVAYAVKGSLGMSPQATGPLDAAESGNFRQARQILDRQVATVEERLRTDKNIIAVLSLPVRVDA